MISDVKTLGKIGVLMGGYSSERDISLKSGCAVVEALASVGANVVAVDIVEHDRGRIIKQLQDAALDGVFIALHGHLGEDGEIQAICRELSLPFTGSGVSASRRAFNKSIATPLMHEHGVPVAPFDVIVQPDDFDRAYVINKVGGMPVVIKPACEGSSIGVVRVDDEAFFDEAVEQAFRYGHEVMVEKYIKGRELTVGILDGKPLPIVEIIYRTSFFDYQAKYMQEYQTEYKVPADLPNEITQMVQEVALNAFQVMGCVDMARVDIILDRHMKPFVLEVNTIPGFTATSLLPKAAAEAGISFSRLCVQLMEMAYGKAKKESV